MLSHLDMTQATKQKCLGGGGILQRCQNSCCPNMPQDFFECSLHISSHLVFVPLLLLGGTVDKVCHDQQKIDLVDDSQLQ